MPPKEGVSGATAPAGATIIEGAGGAAGGATIIEGAAAGATIIEGTQARAEASLNLVPGGSRGSPWPLRTAALRNDRPDRPAKHT